jgi:DNA-binding NtrC family response regulator
MGRKQSFTALESFSRFEPSTEPVPISLRFHESSCDTDVDPVQSAILPFVGDGILETERGFNPKNANRRRRLRAEQGIDLLIGVSPEIRKVCSLLERVTGSTFPVLILGESGTGKEIVARVIHGNGPNAAKPFIPVDCQSLTPDLVASELFGHVKGAFAGAKRSKEGLLSAAGGGTVFLDEVGELSLELQAKLLRAIQEKEVRPMGGTQGVPISARVLAATSRDLIALVRQGRFRKDLYYRLNAVNLRIPPLRERRIDIAILIAHFMECMQWDTSVGHSFSAEALELMTEYDWPGNMRELENTLERAVALSSALVLQIADLPREIREFHLHRPEEGLLVGLGTEQAIVPLDERILSIAEMERAAILDTIAVLHGDKLMAAKLLGIGKTTLYRKLKEYGVLDTLISSASDA